MSLAVRAKHLLFTLRIPPSLRLRAINDFLELCDWLRENPPICQFATRLDLHRYLANRISDGPIDFLEFGVFEGDSIRNWSEFNRHPQSRFIGFDSFEGLPEDWKMLTGIFKKGTFSTDGRIPQIFDMRVRFVKGWFQNSLPSFLENFKLRSQLLIHIDSDIYSSCLFVLSQLNNLIKPGTILLFDEFSSASHEYRALMDFQRAFMRKSMSIASTTAFHAQLAVEITK